MTPTPQLTSGEPNDPFGLMRFVTAQNPVFTQVCLQLRHGRKVGHWMWFAFPQLRGLGSSEMAQVYGISSAAEARAYLAHPILGKQLVECTALVNAVEGRSIEQIFGDIDALKLRSSVTLFAEVAHDKTVFTKVLEKYFAGRGDRLTLNRLALPI